MKPLFYSDYLEGAHPRILDALSRTNMDQTPGYGEDKYCLHAAELIREACGLPEADVHFLVGGTQANATVIASILKPYQGVLCSDCGHIGVHETGAVEHGGHKVLPLPSTDAKITASQILEALEGHWNDSNHEHMVQPGMVYISFPTELGTIYTKKELEDISKVCNDWEIPLFIDGARLGYGLTCQACDITLKELAALADVFYIGGTKQGALFGEAVVIRNEDLKKDFRYNIKQNGGMLAKGRLLGIQFATLFEDRLYFEMARRANALAQRIKEAASMYGIRTFGNSPTNQVFLVVENSRLADLDSRIGYEFWQKYDENCSVIRVCTSWGTTEEAVGTLIEALASIQAI